MGERRPLVPDELKKISYTFRGVYLLTTLNDEGAEVVIYCDKKKEALIMP